MHAFLIIGNNGGIQDLAKKLKAKILEFPLEKIEDVRSLNNLIRLSFNEPTLIVCENIHEATEEALNAFLKNLEEPQPNIYFALTAPSTAKVLPTIVSRCQVIKALSSKPKILNKDGIIKFLNSKTIEKLIYVDKIKDRGEAIALLEDVINRLHETLHSDKTDYQSAAKNAEVATKTLVALRANGNVSLQLANFVISLV